MDGSQNRDQTKMTFISYAQNFEDVMLWRALKNIENGFYIDIGAAWPDQHSVTKAFYEKGWHGINVEPNPHFNELLIKQRSEDINLSFAIGSEDGVLEMNFFNGTGLSTLDNEIAAQHHNDGRIIERKEVQIVTLTKIWRDYVPEDQPVHFLKVDVEGFEAAALRGNNWEINRPWVVVVEATLPMSQTESHLEWESTLLDANYLFAYADGLNRFYLADEHRDLYPKLKYPPNVFDEFTLIAQLEAEAKAQEAQVKAQEAQVKAQEAQVKAQQALNQLESLYASVSWRITTPLRATSKYLRKLLKKL